MSAAAALDAMTEEAARDALHRCCAAHRWVAGMLARRPFGSDAALHDAADEVWSGAGREDVLEAFRGHPRIGADVDALRERWSRDEQGGVAGASEETLRALRDENVRYEARFGHVFIVCATGKSAAEMLELLRDRIFHDPDTELRVAAAEQAKIMHLRLEKLSP